VAESLNFLIKNLEGAILYSIVSFFFSGLFSFMDFCMEVYMKLQLHLPLLFIGDVSMVSIDVHSRQPRDEDTTPSDVELEYYCHDFLKPSKVSPLHVIFGLNGVFARQGKSFKPCILTLTKWYRNLLADPYVIPKLYFHVEVFSKVCSVYLD